jgi:NADPH:quinone reductase-like Zn-dependent oxidoreductase
MSYPKTYRAWRRGAKPYPLKLVLSTEALPDTLSANDVLIRIHAVSLNYRDGMFGTASCNKAITNTPSRDARGREVSSTGGRGRRIWIR